MSRIGSLREPRYLAPVCIGKFPAQTISLWDGPPARSRAAPRPKVCRGRWSLDLEVLIRDLARVDRMLWVVGGGEVVSENSAQGMKEPTFDKDYATVEGQGWHFHLKLDSVADVQFVEAEDHGIPFLYYVRLSNAKEETLLRIYFPNPYLDDNDKPTEFQPDKLKLFQEFRDRYVGQEGIRFVQRTRQQFS